MIIASHIIVSGLLGATTQNYFLAAVFGFVSHYVLDAIPHWDYLSGEFISKVKTETGFLKKKKFWQTMFKVAFDILTGLGLLFIIFIVIIKNPVPKNIIPIFISIFFGVLPDALQLLYWITKWQSIKWNSDLQHFIHYSTHKKIEQGFWPGIITQISTIGIVFLILYKF